MDSTKIFEPFLCLILLTLIVWVYMYAKRIPFIVKSGLSPEQVTPTELARLSPPSVSNSSDNLKNLFELPTLFYAMVLYLYVTDQVDNIFIIASWVFVGFRILHSMIHCTINIVLLRFWLYFISAAALWFMVARSISALIIH